MGFKIPDAQAARSKMLEEKGLLVEIGAAAWMDEPEPRAAVGDIVVISQWCGTLIKGKDGETYRMCNADDVYCVVDPDVAEASEEAA
jgi:co-chaperonin GroES (HSP10)